MKRVLFLIFLLIIAACGTEQPTAEPTQPELIPEPAQPTPEPTPQTTPEPTPEPAKAIIKSTFDDKIVYDLNAAPEAITADKADCEEGGGTFNECGSPCPSDAEFCTAVCAPVCILKSKTAEPTTHEIKIQDFEFKPKVLKIKNGDSIRWTNLGPSTHTATSDGGVFDSGLLGKGQSWTYKFGDPGLFQYHCTPHRGMRASITVQ
ncbi:MAG: plastocyanin/azurin family copper-binding protein [Candidatus Nanoarchaeia archaeon]